MKCYTTHNKFGRKMINRCNGNDIYHVGDPAYSPVSERDCAQEDAYTPGWCACHVPIWDEFTAWAEEVRQERKPSI